MQDRAPKRLAKRAKRGFRGYPAATVALYGPDDATAAKITVGIIPAEGAEASDLRRWVSDGSDIRRDVEVAAEVLLFIEAAGALSVAMPVLGRAGPLDGPAGSRLNDRSSHRVVVRVRPGWGRHCTHTPAWL